MRIKILELFGGIGACTRALDRLGIDYEIADYVEIDKYAVKSYNAINGTKFEPQDITTWDKDIEVDLIMHGSPCQDFSIAGKQAGGDKDSGTRSSLMYETLRIVDKLKPKYIIWENVKNLISKKHIHNFNAYIETMEKLGYNSYYQVLNAKDYGIPQKRERVFTISIRKDIDRGYKFPEKIELKLKLKDLLEDKVDEKYYLSDKMLNCFMSNGTGKFPRRDRFLANINRKNQSLANSITTLPGQRPTDNFVKEYNLKEQLCNKLIENDIVKEGEIINHSYTNSKQRDTLDKFIESKNGIMPTMTTRPDILGIVVKEGTKVGYAVATNGDSVDLSYPNSKNRRGRVGKGISHTLTVGGSMNVVDNLRIRKLTPLECWRLMGFKDNEYYQAEKVNSNAQLYKQAGNSIVVNVLEAILQKLLIINKNTTIYNADCLEQLDKLKENSIDSIVTDPPYELNFMGKGWDNAGISFNKETWEKCLRVLKPGGYLLAFGGSRTYHRIAVAIEDAGFEIRDTIMWLYGSGFPKSMNIGLAIDKKNGIKGEKYIDEEFLKRNPNKLEYHESINNGFKDGIEGAIRYKATNEWNGWGSALKPSFEPIIVSRKPFKGSCIDNVINYGVGGINIDECRVGNEEMKAHISGKTSRAFQSEAKTTAGGKGVDHIGRFPANTILTYDDTDFEEVCGGFPDTKSQYRNVKDSEKLNKKDTVFETSGYKTRIEGGFNDSGSASRYFYCAKASKKDRDEGLDSFNNILGGSYKFREDGSLDGKIPARKNIHPTVKPTELMQYLIRLVTPNGGTVLDPFMGSGSTGKACMYENKERKKNYSFIGIEKDEEYFKIAKARINYAKYLLEDNEEKKEEKMEQISFFDKE